MKCPLCPEELVIVREGTHPTQLDIKCPTIMDPNLSYYDTHYHKHPVNDWGYHGVQEEMIVYPFLIINHDMTYHDSIVGSKHIPGKRNIYCSIKKYNPNRTTRGPLKELRPGFDRLLIFHGYMHPDTEVSLKERLKLLLLFS